MLLTGIISVARLRLDNDIEFARKIVDRASADLTKSGGCFPRHCNNSVNIVKLGASVTPGMAEEMR